MAERDEYLDSLRRLQADFENYKKRVLKQQADQVGAGRRALVDKLLPVLDAFDLATDHVGDNDSDEAKALVAASGLLQGVLAKEGLERIDPVGRAVRPQRPRGGRPCPGRRPRATRPAESGRARGGRGDAGRLPVEGHGGPPGHGHGAGLTARGRYGGTHRRRRTGQRRDTVAPQREWFEKDYYKTLGVPSTATDKEITSAYRKLAKKHHPDANPGNDETFKEISAAYDVLGDADKRKEYDEVRTLGPPAGGFPGGGFPGGGFPGGGTFRVEDLGDLGRPVRRAVRTAGRRGGQQAGPQRGRRRRDRAAPVVRGRGPRGDHVGQRHHRRPVPHLLGIGLGARAPAPSPAPAAAAPARSRTTRACSPSARSVPQCSGRGTIIDHPCPTCSGTGVEHRNRSVKVRHPGRGGGRPAHPGQGPRGGRTGQRTGRRPLRRRPGRAPQPVRPQGAQPDPDRPGDLRRGRPRHDADRAHPRTTR